MADEPFSIKKVPVHARDEAPSKLFGLTWAELGSGAAVLVVCMFFVRNVYLTLGSMALVYLYHRGLKQRLPDNYLKNFARYQRRVWRGRLFYRASGRDTDWVPPILP